MFLIQANGPNPYERGWVIHLEGKIERPNWPRRKGQQPSENTPVLGRWEAGRDYEVAWLVAMFTKDRITLDYAAEIVGEVYHMSTSGVKGAYYKF